MQLKEVDAIRLDECCAAIEDLVMEYPLSLVSDLVVLHDTEALQKYKERAFLLLEQFNRIREKISHAFLFEHFLQEEDFFFRDDLEYRALTEEARKGVVKVLRRELTLQEEICLSLDRRMVSTILFMQSIFELPLHEYYFEVRDTLPWKHEATA